MRNDQAVKITIGQEDKKDEYKLRIQTQTELFQVLLKFNEIRQIGKELQQCSNEIFPSCRSVLNLFQYLFKRHLFLKKRAEKLQKYFEKISLPVSHPIIVGLLQRATNVTAPPQIMRRPKQLLLKQLPKDLFII